MSYFSKHKLDEKGFPVPPSRSKLIPFLLWSSIIGGLFVLQTQVSVYGIALNLTVLVPFYVGLKKSPERGLLAGAAIGLIEDSLAFSMVGPAVLSKGIVGLLSPLMSGRFFIWTPLFGVAALFVMTFLDGFVLFSAKAVFQAPPAEIGNALFEVLVQSLINAPVGYFIRPREN